MDLHLVKYVIDIQNCISDCSFCQKLPTRFISMLKVICYFKDSNDIHSFIFREFLFKQTPFSVFAIKTKQDAR